MFKNIEISEINRSVVTASVWILLIILLVGVTTFFVFQTGSLIGALWVTTMYAMLTPIGGILALLFVLLEYVFLRSKATERTVNFLFVLETGIFVGAVGLFVGFAYSPFLWFFLGTAILGQFVRWLYLKYDNKLLNGVDLKLP